MTSFTYTIQDEQGIHARPAGLLVKEVGKYKSNVELKKGEKTVSAKKLFAVMSLAAKKGETLTITVDGEDEATAAAALEQFFQANL
jgi:phosphocarrier protein HPr